MWQRIERVLKGISLGLLAFSGGLAVLLDYVHDWDNAVLAPAYALYGVTAAFYAFLWEPYSGEKPAKAILLAVGYLALVYSAMAGMNSSGATDGEVVLLVLPPMLGIVVITYTRVAGSFRKEEQADKNE